MQSTPPTTIPIPSPTPTMPRQDRDNEILCAVLAEHDITQADLADATGISRSFISRVMGGQYAVPPAVLREVWNATRDQRVVRIALGDTALDQLPGQPGDQRLAVANEIATTLGQVAESLTRFANGDGVSPQLLRDQMSACCRDMRSLDSHLQATGRVDRTA